VDSKERWLVELTLAGEVVARRRLSSEHRQPEGLGAFSDGRLAVADEGKRGTLTIYRPAGGDAR
jgi:uncharacterized protein YjiK